ncbi:Increased rDNA silencing protein [Linnemannia zychae]|nr:Increased rDNA silencing protein [Linnemannia zychae]
MVQVLQAKALFNCNGDEESELTFLEGDILTDVRETSEDGWLHGRLMRTGEEGLFPDNYVELVHVEVPAQPQLPPLLPSRTTPAAKVATIAPVSETSKPQLPARPNQPSLVTGVRSIPPVDAPSIGAKGPGAAKVGLPGLSSRPTYGNSKNDESPQDTQAVDSNRTQPGLPALPRRKNTLQGNNPTQERTTMSGTALSARDRMAALSSSSQATHNSLLEAPKPALPPRISAANTAESTLSNSDMERKHTYQVADAEVPVPKLTTFSRPRSARNSKASSPVEKKSIALTASEVTTTARSIVPERQAMSTPPQLPSRNAASSTANTPSSDSNGPVRFSPVANRTVPVDLPLLPTISRNSQPLPLPSRTTLNSTITPSSVTKNSQNGLSRSATTGAIRSLGSVQPTSQDSETQNGPLGSAFGVKLNSIGSKPAMAADKEPNMPMNQSTSAPAARLATVHDDFTPPPLPARSNTIPLTPTSYSPKDTLQRSPVSKIQKEAGPRPFSPQREDVSSQIQRDHHLAKVVAGHDSKTWNSNISSTSKSLIADALVWQDIGAGATKASSPNSRGIPIARLPDATATVGVGIPRDARRRYEALFHFVSSSEYIEGSKVHAIYVRSRLDSPTLAQIWDLVDVDNAGKLNKAQFCMGLYLIDERLATGLIPLEVSDELWVSAMQ